MEENNKLIAEFMGLFPDKGWEDSIVPYLLDGMHVNLRYDFSWDWLIPVIKKLYKFDETDVLNIDEFGDDYLDDIKESLLELNIAETYETVVNAIKWYNNNKTN